MVTDTASWLFWQPDDAPSPCRGVECLPRVSPIEKMGTWKRTVPSSDLMGVHQSIHQAVVLQKQSRNIAGGAVKHNTRRPTRNSAAHRYLLLREHVNTPARQTVQLPKKVHSYHHGHDALPAPAVALAEPAASF